MSDRYYPTMEEALKFFDGNKEELDLILNKPVSSLIEEARKAEFGVAYSALIIGGLRAMMAVCVCGETQATSDVVEDPLKTPPSLGKVEPGMVLSELFFEAFKSKSIALFQDESKSFVILASSLPPDTQKLESLLSLKPYKLTR